MKRVIIDLTVGLVGGLVAFLTLAYFPVPPPSDSGHSSVPSYGCVVADCLGGRWLQCCSGTPGFAYSCCSSFRGPDDATSSVRALTFADERAPDDATEALIARGMKSHTIEAGQCGVRRGRGLGTYIGTTDSGHRTLSA
jgi:hypothetical protein